MEITEIPYFPYPRLIESRRIPGYKMTWPRQCDACDRQCEHAQTRALSVCSYGINFQRLDEGLLVFGIVVPTASVTGAQKKTLRQNPRNRVSSVEFQRAISQLSSAQLKFQEEVESAKREIVQEYREQQRFKKDLLEDLKPEIERNLAFLHDYKQFVARVKQNINVVLEQHYGPGDIDQLLAKALHAEAAIYWAATLMTEKLQTAFLLLHPERLQSPSPTTFRLHGLVLKYIRIYQTSFDDKGVRLDVTGHSTGEIKADSSAVGVIPQTLLDNALKYSERDSKITVDFQEDSESITLSVNSYGAKIDVDEMKRIFDLFYRGRHAVQAQEEGAGFGLHLAQFVARSIGSEITVKQKPTKSSLGFETCFSVKFQRYR